MRDHDIRLIDFLKQRQITAFLTNLTSGGEALKRATDVEIYFSIVRHLAFHAGYLGRSATEHYTC